MENRFYSKVLLFGEYSVIKGGMGLAMPCKKYYGKLEFKDHPIPFALQLEEFSEYLGQRSLLSKVMNISQLKEDIRKNLYFNSNIPFGHGVGSSGALCAALYTRYATDENFMNKKLGDLQDIMALMESFYHGTSSGLDCLISLINKPVYISSRNKVEVCMPPNLEKMGYFYLYETGISRNTGPLVHQFIKDYAENNVFRERFQEFKKYSDEIIQIMNDGSQLEFIRLMQKISKLQLIHFSHMIPDQVKNFWSEGLKSGSYYMKLCGAGGGGFFLLYSKEKIVQKKLIPLK